MSKAPGSIGPGWVVAWLTRSTSATWFGAGVSPSSCATTAGDHAGAPPHAIAHTNRRHASLDANMGGSLRCVVVHQPDNGGIVAPLGFEHHDGALGRIDRSDHAARARVERRHRTDLEGPQGGTSS